MLANLVTGTLLMVLNLGIQVLAVAVLIRYFSQRIGTGALAPTLANDARTLGVVMAVLMAGHAFMFATWALLFVWLGEFGDFATAFYHSTVNFTSLGYGDIVMSEERRLLADGEVQNEGTAVSDAAGASPSVAADEGGKGSFDRREERKEGRGRGSPGERAVGSEGVKEHREAISSRAQSPEGR